METGIFAGFLRMTCFLSLGEVFPYEGDTKDVTDIWEGKKPFKIFVVKLFSENYLQIRLYQQENRIYYLNVNCTQKEKELLLTMKNIKIILEMEKNTL